MPNFVVVKGRRFVVGSSNCEYSIVDIIDIRGSDPEEQMRAYSIKKFIEMGKNADTITDNIFCYRKNITLDSGVVLAERIKVFAHDVSGDFFGFIPAKAFKGGR